jgi:general secretion pathway protein C
MKLHHLFRKHFWLIAINALSVAAFLHARGLNALVAIGVAPASSVLAALSGDADGQTRGEHRSPEALREVRAAAILARNAFDSVTGPLRDEANATITLAEDAAASTDPRTAPPCDGVRVLAIAASTDPNWSFASLTPRDRDAPVMRRRGGELDGKTVSYIASDRVWLSDANGLCQAAMWAAPVTAPPQAKPKPPQGSLTSEVSQGIHAKSATSFTIERQVVEKVREHSAELLGGSHVMPETTGAARGFRLSRIDGASPLGLIGLQNGDLLESINGFDLTNAEEALTAYARLGTADHLTVTVLRGGKVQNLDYDITN